DFFKKTGLNGDDNPLNKSISDILANMNQEMKQLGARAKFFGLSIREVKAKKISILNDYIEKLVNSLLPTSIEKAKELRDTVISIQESMRGAPVKPIVVKVGFIDQDVNVSPKITVPDTAVMTQYQKLIQSLMKLKKMGGQLGANPLSILKTQ